MNVLVYLCINVHRSDLKNIFFYLLLNLFGLFLNSLIYVGRLSKIVGPVSHTLLSVTDSGKVIFHVLNKSIRVGTKFIIIGFLLIFTLI